MTENRFRTLIVVYLVLFALATLSGLFAGDYSPELEAAFEKEPEAWLSRNFGFAIGALLLLLGGTLLGLAGLWAFKPWGRTVSVLTTLFAFPVALLMGNTLESPIETILGEASSILWGVILALAYFSSVSHRFTPELAGKNAT